MTPPLSIDRTDISGATIDGQEVKEITVDGQTVFTAAPPVQQRNADIYLRRDNNRVIENNSSKFEARIVAQDSDGGEIMVGSSSRFNYRDVESVEIDWEGSVDSSIKANIGVDPNRNNITDNDIDDGNPDFSFQRQGTFNRRTDSLFIGGDNDFLHVGFGFQNSSSIKDSGFLEIYSVRLVNSNGDPLVEYLPPY